MSNNANANVYSPMSLTDDIFDTIEEEKQSNRRSTGEDLKVPEGHECLIRILPTVWKENNRNVFWAKIAQHWINKRPHFCTKHTPVEHGGRADGECQMCEVADNYNLSPDRAVSTAGYRHMSKPQWLVFCLVWSREDGRNEAQLMEPPECWIPHRFWLNQTSFEEITTLFKRHRRRKDVRTQQVFEVPNSILDIEEGMDLVVRNNKNLKISRDETRSLFVTVPDATEDEKQAILNEIWSQIRVPTYHELGQAEIDAAIAKIHEAVTAAQKGPAPAPRQNARQTADVDQSDMPPRGRTVAPRGTQTASVPAPQRSQAPAPRPAPPAQPQTQRAQAPAPASTRSNVPAPRPTTQARPPAPQPRTPAPRPAAPAPAPEPEQSDDVPFDEQPPDDQVDFGEAQEPAQPVQQTASSRLRAARPAPAVQTQRKEVASTLDDNDNVTDEQNDLAPSADGLSGVQDEAPPEVVPVQTQPAVQARPRLSDRLRQQTAKQN